MPGSAAAAASAAAGAKDAGPATQLAISLNPREQSLLYCELEYHLTGALHDYITAELERGHLVADNLKKISDVWSSQGRPKVVGFRYDLETQLELVKLHVNDFNFYGRRQSSPVEIAGLLHAMKVNARQMRVRTFCQPDPVIAKQLVDSQSLFNMINVSRARHVGLAEIAQFFKVIIERERDCREKRSREMRKTHVAQPGHAFIGGGGGGGGGDDDWTEDGQQPQPQPQPQPHRHERRGHEARHNRHQDEEARFRESDRVSYRAEEASGYEFDEDPLPYAR